MSAGGPTDARAAAGVFPSVQKEIGSNTGLQVGGTSDGPPTTEVGVPASVGVLPWSQLWVGDPLETVPQLQWPVSPWTYASMMNDSQLEGLLAGSTLPIRRYRWFINPNGCDPKDVKALAADLNLPLKDEDKEPAGRLKNRIKHDRVLFHALKALPYGFYFNEIVGEVRDDGLWHLTKLAPRPPLTIMDITSDDKGELAAIIQNVTQPGKPVKPIVRNQLAAFIWEQEGSNYTGRSMFRAVYRNWLIKDRLLRVDALKHERNGMGVPIAKGQPGAGKGDLESLNRTAQRLKSGDTSGAAIPNGADIELKGVQGTLPDTVASINMHNEEMARRFLMMFMQLGSTLHGSRALGSEFIDYFQLSQEAIANWYRDTMNEDVVESWWNWNYGEDTDSVPKLEYERDDDPRLVITDLAAMVEKGVVQVDDELEAAVRTVMELPQFKGPVREPAVPEMEDEQDPKLPSTEAEPPGAKAKRQRRAVLAVGDNPLPDRTLRRQLYDQEVASKINLAQMDAMWQNAVTTLFGTWKTTVTKAQIEQLSEAVRNTADLGKLSTIEVTPQGKDLLIDAMSAMFNAGASMAMQELEDQGQTKFELPNAETHLDKFTARASAVDNVAARTLGNMGSAKAVSASGGTLTRAQVGDHVQGYLEGLTHSMLKDRLAGSMTQAMNAGRRAVMSEGPPAEYYASEILDNNTCEQCTSVDGTQYNNVGESESDYPGGGYVNCEGGERCRGTIVAVYKEENKDVAVEEP